MSKDITVGNIVLECIIKIQKDHIIGYVLVFINMSTFDDETSWGIGDNGYGKEEHDKSNNEKKKSN